MRDLDALSGVKVGSTVDLAFVRLLVRPSRLYPHERFLTPLPVNPDHGPLIADTLVQHIRQLPVVGDGEANLS